MHQSEPIIVVTSDSHIGPRPHDLRPYCPAAYVEDFDDYFANAPTVRVADAPRHTNGGKPRRHELNMRTEGHHDMHARLRDMDADGIAAEVIFHGSQNGQPFPLSIGTMGSALTPASAGAGLRSSLVTASPQRQAELTAVGIRTYNRWLADVVSIQPERHIGLAHVPSWDPMAAVEEVEWAYEAGLRGVNWPAPRPGGIEYDDPAWEPFWAACAQHGLHLNTHAGALVPGVLGLDGKMDLPQSEALIRAEAGGWPARRGIHRMIFGGVFERHPALTLVVTEQPGVWWRYTLQELDSIWDAGSAEFHHQVPRPPSEYFAEQVVIGASFMARFEAEAALEDRMVDSMLWGSDYPHREGTWAYRETEDDLDRNRLALRNTFHGLEPTAIRSMLGENAIRVFGLDRAKLHDIASRIAAPLEADLAAPLMVEEREMVGALSRGEMDHTAAFRVRGPWQ